MEASETKTANECFEYCSIWQNEHFVFKNEMKKKEIVRSKLKQIYLEIKYRNHFPIRE